MAGKILDSFDTLIANLQQNAGYASKSVNDALMQSMQLIQKESIARAPVEHGDLERAIKLSNDGYRKSWSVYVDMTMPDNTGKYTIGDYAPWLHDGQYKLGPASEAKNSSGKVGRKFLEGPFQEAVDAGLTDSLQKILNDAISSRGY